MEIQPRTKAMTMAEFDMNLLTILNDDCIYQILEWLPLHDLCLCSRTCKRFQALSENQFHRKYTKVATKEVAIGIEYDGRLRLPFYVEYFDNFIKYVRFNGWNFNQNEELKVSRIANFVKTKCDQNLRKISIWGDMELSPSFCKKIENFLRAVEVVQYEIRAAGAQSEATLHRYFPNLTTLILRGVNVNMVDAILLQKYEQLTHFYYLDVDVEDLNHLNAEKLQIFFQTNEKIKCVAWSVSNNGKTLAQEIAVKYVRTICHAINLQHFFLHICNELATCFDKICSHLNGLCGRDNLKALEMKFYSEKGADALNINVSQLAKWKQLTKIHLVEIRLSDVISALRSLVHLKIVHLSCVVNEWMRWSNFDELITLVDSIQNMTLPQIEEVQFNGMGYKKLSTFVMLFVRHWRNLKIVKLPHTMYLDDTTFNIVELDRARAKLNNASELTIFTNHEGNATNLDHKLVKLKFVNFYDDNLDVFPFQEYYMATG